MKQTHTNELPELNDIYDNLIIEDDFTNTSYHEDFLETIDIFIDEYVNSHIMEYKEKDFEDIVRPKEISLALKDVKSDSSDSQGGQSNTK